MLETLDLDKSISKTAYDKTFKPLRDKLRELQQQCYEAKVPVLVVFEGWDAAGKGDTIEKLVGRLDPRGYRVHPVYEPLEEERLRPFLWRFWTRIPARGEIAIFDQSWYRRVLSERVEKEVSKEDVALAWVEINQFERMLADDGTVIVKFWLHISEKEQLRRFRHREREPLKRWKLTEEDWRNREKRGAYTEAVEDMLEHTDHPDAPWDVVPAEHKKYGRVHVIETAIARIEEGMKARGFRPLTDKELEAA